MIRTDSTYLRAKEDAEDDARSKYLFAITLTCAIWDAETQSIVPRPKAVDFNILGTDDPVEAERIKRLLPKLAREDYRVLVDNTRKTAVESVPKGETVPDNGPEETQKEGSPLFDLSVAELKSMVDAKNGAYKAKATKKELIEILETLNDDD